MKTTIIITALIAVATIFYLFSNSYKDSRISEQKRAVVEKEKNEPIFKAGNYHYNIVRMKITSTPQKYTFPIDANWEGWYDNPSTGEPFWIQFSLDGEKIDSRQTWGTKHPPVGEIWLSTMSGKKDQWITLSYSYSKKKK